MLPDLECQDTDASTSYCAFEDGLSNLSYHLVKSGHRKICDEAEPLVGLVESCRLCPRAPQSPAYTASIIRLGSVAPRSQVYVTNIRSCDFSVYYSKYHLTGITHLLYHPTDLYTSQQAISATCIEGLASAKAGSLHQVSGKSIVWKECPYHSSIFFAILHEVLFVHLP